MTNSITWKNERRKLRDLIPWDDNPRSIKRDEAVRLVDSLIEFGQIETIAIEPDNTIVDGHQRESVWKAASQFGPDYEVDVRVANRKLTLEERQKLVIFLHKGAVGEWDFDALANSFEVDDLLKWGFSEEELQLRGFDLDAAGTSDGGSDATEPDQIETDRFQEVAEKWKTADSQVWQLGRHKILCGDCLDPDNIKRLLGDTVPDLILADPPYGVNIVATNVSVGGGEAYNIPFGGRKKGYVGGENSIKDRTGHYPIEKWRPKGLTGSDGASKPFGTKAVRGTVGAAHVVEVGKYPVVIGDENTDVAEQAVTLYCDLYPKAVQVWWGANYYSPVLPASMCWVVWNKETTGNFADCELAWTNQNKAAKLFTHRWNGMLRDSERERRWHPTQKPAALAAWIYGEFVKEDAVIVDPFAGAGWSVLGGEQSNRTVFAMEKSHEYIAVILERWSILTGGTPHLLP
jgi:hypothetical protein